MIGKPLLMVLVLGALSLGSAMAMTPGDAANYRLDIRHVAISELSLDGHAATELTLTVTNLGQHTLYDLRLFLESVGPISPVADDAPARIRKIEAGQRVALNWTYESMLPLHVGDWQNAVFRIEAIDESTQQVVTFTQPSTRGN
jgi:hypothetical protein